MLREILNLIGEVLGFFELLEAEVCHGIDRLSLLKVAEGGSLHLLSPVLHVDKEEGSVRVEEHLLDVANVATLDAVVVEEHVGNLHEGLVHAVLGVEEGVLVFDVDETRVKRRRPDHFETIGGSQLLLVAHHHDLLGVHRC